MTGPTWLQDKQWKGGRRKPESGPLYHYTYGSAIACPTSYGSSEWGQCTKCLRTYRWLGMGVHLKYCKATINLEVQA